MLVVVQQGAQGRLGGEQQGACAVDGALALAEGEAHEGAPVGPAVQPGVGARRVEGRERERAHARREEEAPAEAHVGMPTLEVRGDDEGCGVGDEEEAAVRALGTDVEAHDGEGGGEGVAVAPE